MFKNTLLLLLVIVCAMQSYILYTNKDKDWLAHTLSHAKSTFKDIAKPSSDAAPQAPRPAASAVIEKPATQVNSSTTITTETTTTKSFAFEHLSTNVNCEHTTNVIDEHICANTDLRDQDKRLNFILQKWAQSTKTSNFPIMDQDQWIESRFQTCSKTTQASMQSCIQSITEKRIQAITGQI